MNSNIKWFASPWTAPIWMKTNNDYTGRGFLKLEYYQAWANYFVRFLDEYAKRNVSFWAVTAQNEPFNGMDPFFRFNCMGGTPEQMRDFITNNLGPTIGSSLYNSTKIIMLDDQRSFVTTWTRTVFGDPEANKYDAGTGVHWYGSWYPAAALTLAHEEFPDKFILGTEASVGSFTVETDVILGSWERAEMYAQDICIDLNNWVVGWTDWNIVLYMKAAPNWAGNFVDSPIIFDSSKGEFYKQPMFYALGHFSKFLSEGSVRVCSTSYELIGVYVTAFERPDGAVVVIVLNLGEFTQKVALKDTHKSVVVVNIGSRSINTIVY